MRKPTSVVDAFENLPTWNTKVKLLVAAVRRRLGDEPANKLSELLRNIEKRQNRRNNVVHARWFASDQPQQWKRLRSIVGLEKPEEYDLAKLYRIDKEIQDDVGALTRFYNEALPLLKSIGNRQDQILRDTLFGTISAPEQDEDHGGEGSSAAPSYSVPSSWSA